METSREDFQPRERHNVRLGLISIPPPPTHTHLLSLTYTQIARVHACARAHTPHTQVHTSIDNCTYDDVFVVELFLYCQSRICCETLSLSLSPLFFLSLPLSLSLSISLSLSLSLSVSLSLYFFFSVPISSLCHLSLCPSLFPTINPVSYTHLTLPTRRTV